MKRHGRKYRCTFSFHIFCFFLKKNGKQESFGKYLVSLEGRAREGRGGGDDKPNL